MAVLPVLPEDYSNTVVESIKNQSVPVSDLIVLSKRGVGDTFPAKMSNVLNEGLRSVCLKEYDYLLRVDGDTVLPYRFVESNLALNADVVGYGHAHLIKVSSFISAMGGVFHPESDDSYLNFKFMKEGLRWSYWNTKPQMFRKPGRTHSIRYFLERGQIMWIHGYEPLHVLGSFRWEPKNILCVFGYFGAMLRRVSQLDVAPFVFWYQIRKLKGDLARRRRY